MLSAASLLAHCKSIQSFSFDDAYYHQHLSDNDGGGDGDDKLIHGMHRQVTQLSQRNSATGWGLRDNICCLC